MNTENLRSTGLTQVELGKIFGVTRITIIGWMKGRFTPHPLHRAKVNDLAERLDLAVKEGRLPLPASVGRPARLAAARTAIGLTD